MSWWIVYEWNGSRVEDSYVLVKADTAEQARQRMNAKLSLRAVGDDAWMGLRVGGLQLDPPRELPDADPRVASLPESECFYVNMRRDDCPACVGRGWVWRAQAETTPRQAPTWLVCHPCNGTGLATRSANFPRRPKPTEPPA